MRLTLFIMMMIMVVVATVPVLVAVAVLVKMLVWIVKMHVTFANHLADQIIQSEKEQRSAGDAWEPGTDRSAKRSATQSNGKPERGCDHDVPCAGERSYRDGFRGAPSLDTSRKHKGQPMRGYRRVKKRHPKAGERDGSKDGLVHCDDQQRARASGWWDLNPRPLRPERSALPS